MIDANNIDKNVQALKAVERSWGSPQIPDMVKLDLAAMSGLDATGIQKFAFGLGRDMAARRVAPMQGQVRIRTQVGNQEVEAPTPQDPNRRSYSVGENLTRRWRGLAGLRPEESVEADAVSQWKRRAINLGYLPEDTPIDNTWNAALNPIHREMKNDDYTMSMRGGGNREMALPIMRDPEGGLSVLELLDDWLSPTGAAKAAVWLGFVPDIKKWEEDKKAYRDNPTPGNFWRSIDDMAFPLLNIGLMFTGIGEVKLVVQGVMAAKKTAQGVKGLQLANGALRIGRTETAARTALGGVRFLGATPVDEIASGAFMQAKTRGAMGGMLSNRLSRSPRPVVSGIGNQMAAWRNLRGVVVGKELTTQTMRLGIAQRTEQALGYTPEDSHSLASWKPEVSEWADKIHSNLVAAVVTDAMFSPYQIFAPGQLASAATPFRYIRSSLGKVGRDQFFGEEAAVAFRHSIINPTGDIDYTDEAAAALRQTDLDNFDEEVRTLGSARAVAKRLGLDADMGDNVPEAVRGAKFGGWLTYMMTMAAVEAESAGNLKALRGVLKGPLRESQDYHVFRNNLVAQLRHIDPENIAEALWSRAWSRAKTQKGALKEYEASMELMKDPRARETMKKYIIAHNENRVKVFAELMETHARKGLLSEYMIRNIDAIGNDWDGFTHVSQRVREAAGNGELANVSHAAAINPVTKQPLKSTAGKVVEEGVDGHFSRVPKTQTLEIDDLINDPEFLRIANKNVFAPLLKEIPTGRFTPLRKGSLTKQELLAEYGGIKRLYALLDTVDKLSRYATADIAKVSKAVRSFIKDGETLAQVSIPQLNKAMTAAGLNTETRRRIRRLWKYAREHEIDIEGGFAPVGAALKKRLDDINLDPKWSTRYEIDMTLDLRGKQRALRRKAAFTASRVDVASMDPELVKYLDDNGYELVHGVEFAAPQEMMETMREVQDINDLSLFQESLGLVGTAFQQNLNRGQRVARGLSQSFERYEPQHVRAWYRAAMKNGLRQHLTGVGTREFGSRTSPAVDILMNDLQKIARDIGKRMNDGWIDSRVKNPLMRGWANMESSFTPQTPHDLVRGTFVWKKAVGELEALGYSTEEINGVFKGLKAGRVVGPQLRGRFTNWMDEFQSKPNLLNAMGLVSKTEIENGSYLQKTSLFGFRGAGAAAGGFVAGVGGALDPVLYEDDATIPDHIFAFSALFSGMLVGRAMTAKGAMKLFNAKLELEKTRLRLGSALARGAHSVGNNPKSMWKNFAYLGDTLAKYRDFLRFSVSPIFDASRYSEALVLGQIGVPEAVRKAGGVRMNLSPTQWRRGRISELTGVSWRKGKGETLDLYEFQGRLYSKAEIEDSTDLFLPGQKGENVSPRTMTAEDAAAADWDSVVKEFSTVQKNYGDYDYDALEAGTARFRQIGILGFNTQQWEASLYSDLTRIHGMARDDAYRASKAAFSYGVNPRSAAEMNVNAVFFPFSFMKKTVGHTAEFMMEDWSRTGMIHAGLRTYEALDEKYDLESFFAERMPALEKFQRMNVYAYGVSMGALGGANRPLLDWFNSTPMADGITNPIANLFSPIGIHPENTGGFTEFTEEFMGLMPVMNDLAALQEDLKAQGHVMFGGTFMTAEAEAVRGYAEERAVRAMIHDIIVEDGEPDGFAALNRRGFEGWKQVWADTKDRLAQQYPGYLEAKFDSVSYAAAKASEGANLKDEARAYAAAGVDVFGEEATARQRLGHLILLSDDIQNRAGGYDYLTPAQIEGFLTVASAWADNDDIVRIGWRTHLRTTWGPIESEIR